MNPELWGAIGYAIALVGFMSRADAFLKVAVIIACTINAFYFFAIDMHITAAVNIITALRIGVTFIFKPFWLGMFFILLSLSTPFWLSSADWLSVAASVLGTIAVFWTSGLQFRWLMLATTACLFLNAWQFSAWSGMVGEGLILLVSMYRIVYWNPPASVETV